MKRMKKAFTLIELLIVVAIIGILAAIIIINVASARVKAAKSQVSSNMSVATRTYAACDSFKEGPAAPVKAPVSGQGAATNVTCNSVTSITDLSERSAATGSWPILPNTNFAYIATGASAEIGKVRYNSETNSTVTCTITGCLTGTTW